MSLFYVIIKKTIIFSNTTFQGLYFINYLLFKLDEIKVVIMCNILSFSIGSYVCVHTPICMGAFVYRCAHAHVYTCMWRPGNIVGCHPQENYPSSLR